MKQYQVEKLFNTISDEFSKIFIYMSGILGQIYTFMEEGDRMKKLEAYFLNMEDCEILQEDDDLLLEVPGEGTKHTPEKALDRKKSRKM